MKFTSPGAEKVRLSRLQVRGKDGGWETRDKAYARGVRDGLAA